MKNNGLSAILLTGTLISTPALADVSIFDVLNGSTPNFTWGNSEFTDVTPIDNWSGKGSVFDPVANTTVYYKYTLPSGYVGFGISETAPFSVFVNEKVLTSNIYLYNNDNYSNAETYWDSVNSSLQNYNQVGDLVGDWVGTNSSGSSYSILNQNNQSVEKTTIGNLTGSFIGTSGIQNIMTEADREHGYRVEIGDITAQVIAANNNSFLYNYSGTVGDISANYIVDNIASSGDTEGKGGFIHNQGIIDFYYQPQYTYSGYLRSPEQFSATIGNISGTIANNVARGTPAAGGAIYNHYGQIGTISGDLIGNRVIEDTGEAQHSAENTIPTTGEVITYPSITGGAINNYNGKIGTITSSNISNNSAYGDRGVAGGAIYNESSLYAEGQEASNGTEVWKNNGVYGQAMNINGSTFNGNSASSTSRSAAGGAIAHLFGVYSTWSDDTSATLASLTSNGYSAQDYASMISTLQSQATLNLINTSFINNSVTASDGAYGGAIYSSGDVNIEAKNAVTSLFSGNTANGESNAIFMDTPMIYSNTGDSTTYYANLNLHPQSDGNIQFDDAIDGTSYNVNVHGDGTGEVRFYNDVKNVHNLNLSQNSSIHLGKTSSVYADNMISRSSGTIVTPGAGLDNPIITLDVEVDQDNNTVNTPKIYINQDVSGEYQVIVNSLNTYELSDYTDAIVPFLFAPDDDTSTESSFTIARIIGSPYMWKSGVNVNGETSGSTWYLNLDGTEPDPEPEPDPDPEPEPTPPTPKPDITPEIIAAIGLHEASIEQTRSLVHNVRSKVEAQREFCPSCGLYDWGWDYRKLNNFWVLAQGDDANIDRHVEMEAKIRGVEAGMDFQGDFHNTLGLFASYRQGEYELSGKGDKYSSTIGSDIDIDSYIAGLYYRYDRNRNWAFASIYAGIQEAEVTTRDNIAKFKTDGTEFGASLELGHVIALTRTLTLDPSIGVYYTQVDFDDAKDNVGKQYTWEEIKHLEAELGAKLEQQFSDAKVYIKPSVIQTFSKGDSVVVTGLSEIDTYKDQTLGRIEAGIRLGITHALSGYAWGNYTFGSDYDAVSLGGGLNYAW